MKQPRGMLFDQLVPRFPAKPPHRSLFDGNDGGGAGLSRKERHFTETVLWAEDCDVFFASAGALEHDLNRTGLDEVKRIALFPLRENRGSSRKGFLFEPAQNFRYVLARKGGEKRDSPQGVGKISHCLANNSICLGEGFRRDTKTDDIGRSKIDHKIKFGCPLYRDILRLRPFKKLVHE